MFNPYAYLLFSWQIWMTGSGWIDLSATVGKGEKLTRPARKQTI